jgi:hypothetical protein
MAPDQWVQNFVDVVFMSSDVWYISIVVGIMGVKKPVVIIVMDNVLVICPIGMVGDNPVGR